jgi:hypothetical protein
LQTQLQAVETSLQHITWKELNNELLEDCIRNVAEQTLEAKFVLGGIDKVLRNVEHKDAVRDFANDKKPSITKWLRRRPDLIKLTTWVRPIVHLLTVTTSIVHAVACYQTLNRYLHRGYLVFYKNLYFNPLITSISHRLKFLRG